MKALVELAEAISEGEKAQDVSELVQSALEQYKAETKSAASTDIVSLVRKIEQHKVEKKKEIRRLKRSLNDVIGGLKELDRRWAYAQKSNNFMPVLEHFGLVDRNQLVNPSDFDELVRVPSDFKETKAEE
jgi:hypothetical protein